MAKFNDEIFDLEYLSMQDRSKIGVYLQALLPPDQLLLLLADWRDAYGNNPGKYPLWKYALDKIEVSYTTQPIKPVRIIQCFDDGHLHTYYTSESSNPCGCGSNCFHYEYDTQTKKMYGVCNTCKQDVYDATDAYTQELLQTGKWLPKEE